jgi:hypothetical protein
MMTVYNVMKQEQAQDVLEELQLPKPQEWYVPMVKLLIV